MTAGAQYERHQAIMVEGWRRAGLDTEPYALPLAAGRQNEVRATFPGLTQIGTGSTENSVLRNFISANIGTASNRWLGHNRGGWSNTEMDRLWDVYNVTLVQSERQRQVIAMAKILSQEVPAYPLYPNIGVRAHVAGLRGHEKGVVSTLPCWNVHEWTLS